MILATVNDKDGREIYITEERWQHILENHPDMTGHFDELVLTIKQGQRKHVVLFIDTKTEDAVGITLHNYSRLLTMPALPLAFTEKYRNLQQKALMAFPVNQFLHWDKKHITVENPQVVEFLKAA